jgi:Ca-activated chloride channel homolog
MTTTRLAVAIAFVASAWISAAQNPPQGPPRFRSSAAAVMVDVSVRDRTRRVVTGLKAEDFTILDNGVPQRVGDVSYGKLPIDVTVALDVSQSVSGGVLKQMQSAVRELMKDLAKEDRLKLVLFNTQIVRTIDFTTDEEAVARAVREVKAGGSTALLDAVGVTLVSKADPNRRQLIMVFTDGSDSSSTTAPAIILEVAQRTRATLAFVMPSQFSATLGLFDYSDSGVARTTTIRPKTAPVHAVLQSLANETGGTIISVGQGGLASTFRSVLNDFRSAYVLYYTPTGVERGGYHTIEVKVDRDGVRVQARRGYFS